ncbi:MAG TPA: hypothetical protein VF581_02025 [Flavobacterium sp.]|jgi:hypothetical protein
MKKSILSFCLVIAIVSCTPFKPALSSADVNTVEIHEVRGRQGLLINQKLQFAEFYTGKVKRSWTKGGNSHVPISQGTATDILFPDLISLGYSSRNQTFSFQMQDSIGNKSDLYAATEFVAEDLQIGTNSNSLGNILEDVFGKNDVSDNLFYVQLYVNNDKRPWQLVLDNNAAQSNSKGYTGVFSLDEKHFYTIKPITKIMGKNGPTGIPMGSIGFEILNSNDDFVAAVSLIDKGSVFFKTSDKSERFLLANLCAALLLQENIAE